VELSSACKACLLSIGLEAEKVKKLMAKYLHFATRLKEGAKTLGLGY